ncbi:MAG TPA: CHRD domain-containing protein [Lentimicrobium sp.]|nr:CHRD domain-containing protein [Lentimicrobium sp.]
MKKLLLFSTFLMLFWVAKSQDTLRGLVFSAVLDTTLQDSVSTSTSASGIAGFLYQNDSLKFEITVNGLTAEITGAEIRTESDSILLNLDDYIERNSIRGNIPDIALDNELLKQILTGTSHLVIYTEANPMGEIGGMIKLETEMNYGAALDIEQAGITDTLESMPQGLSSFNLSIDSMRLEVNVLVTGLTSPITNAHLHYGAPGIAGPAVVPLMPYNEGNTFRGVVNLDSITDPMGFLDSLNIGSVYVNVHTTNYPGGEVRGQLSRHEALSFDSWMDTEQETDTLDPATPEMAHGLTHMYINEAIDSLWVHVLVDSLSGPVSASHFHMGVMGEPGPVIIPLTIDTTMGNMIMATITAQDTTFTDEAQFTTFLTNVLNGNIFINVHTDLNPGGEIRGQIRAVAHTGTIFNLCSRQEVGTVTNGGDAQGSGVVSMDRDREMLHYAIAVCDLSSALTGAHFHQAPAGQNGDIIFTLPTDSTVYGYWNDTSFTSEIAALFESGGIYANFHTTVNPAGEIRGQVMLSELCSAPLAVGDIAVSRDISIYPNPVQDHSVITYTLTKESKVTIKIFDLTGKEISYRDQGQQNSGTYKQSLNTADLRNGVYIVSLVVDNQNVFNGKMIVNR